MPRKSGICIEPISNDLSYKEANPLKDIIMHFCDNDNDGIKLN